MKPPTDQEWYWLRRIYLQMTETNVLLDWIVPIATTLLAVAAIYLAYRSFRTAHDANTQAQRFREEDLKEKDLRWRRTFAVDLKDWYRDEWFGVFLNDDADRDRRREAFSALIKECDLEGNDIAKRFTRYLHRELDERREGLQAMSPKQLAVQRHPSRLLGYRDGEALVDNWINDPESILLTLSKAAAAENDRRKQAMVDALPQED
jgi:hypothetical protein